MRYGLARVAGVTSLCPRGHQSLARAREEWAASVSAPNDSAFPWPARAKSGRVHKAHRDHFRALARAREEWAG